MKTIKSVSNKLGKFFGKLWQIFTALLIAPWRLDYKSDDFEEVFSFGPFILSYDVVTEWVLFIRQREPGYHLVVSESPAPIMNILYSLGQFNFKMAFGYLFVFLLDTFAEVVSRVIGSLDILTSTTKTMKAGVSTDIRSCAGTSTSSVSTLVKAGSGCSRNAGAVTGEISSNRTSAVLMNT